MGERWAVGLFLAMAGVARAAQEPAVPTGPISYWKLDETSGTAAANVIAGSPVANYKTGAFPVPSATVAPLSYNTDPGVTARSLQFNGSSQGLTVQDFAGGLNAYTVSVWIQRTGSTGTRQSIVSFKETGGGFVLSLNEDGTNFRPRIWSNIAGAWRNAEEAFTLPTGAWIHLAATFDGTNLRLYRGLNAPTSVVFAGALGGGTASTGIGMRNSNDQHYFPGMIDDLRLYNRALDANEVSVLAAGVPAPTGVTATAAVNEIMLTWTAPPQAVTYSYRVLRRPAGSTGAFTVIVPSTPVTSYLDYTAYGGSSWEYAVRAVSVAESGISGTSTATSLAPPPRYEDHEEGASDDNCTCGAASPGSPVLLLLGLISLLAFLRRRG